MAAPFIPSVPKLWPDERAMARAEVGDSFALLREEQDRRRGDLPDPAPFHRLPLACYQQKTAALLAEARERGIDGGIFLTNRWNIIYATGLFHSATERPFACFLPADQHDAIIWFHPYLDTELVESWWCTQSFSYFDFPEAEGGAPPQGLLGHERFVDLYRWWGTVLSELGYGAKTIGVDSGGAAELGLMPGWEARPNYDFFAVDKPVPFRPRDGALGQMAAAMPEARLVDVHDIIVRHRAEKDELETSIAQRALDYLSEIHAFTREYILQRGHGILDWEIASTARLWGMHRIMRDVPSSGLPHETAGIELRVTCRAGVATAYPHPNQLNWHPIEPGDALQFETILNLGGYGGELFRSFLIGPSTSWQEKVWTVHTRAYEIQAEESFAGNTGAAVAKAVHSHQIESGCAHLVYHRPGHGQGSEGHQPPYHALGDHTMLRAGMHFSNEPGLYDIANGFGFNHGNMILVGEARGLQMGTAPATKEWCLLTL
jgi:Xaa-Pro dipeptidase